MHKVKLSTRSKSSKGDEGSTDGDTPLTEAKEADKVSDGGDHLLVRIGREEERISFGNIASVHE